MDATLRETTRSALADGHRLFNAGRFFEAHEVWEAAWLREDGKIRELLQGLIQIAAGFHQGLDRGNASGCARLLTAGNARLEPLPSEFAGLALGAFRGAMEVALAKARAWKRGSGEPLRCEDAPPLDVAEE